MVGGGDEWVLSVECFGVSGYDAVPQGYRFLIGDGVVGYGLGFEYGVASY